MDGDALVALAQLVKVEAHKRRSKTGKTEHVHTYIRKDLDVAGFGDAQTKKGVYSGFAPAATSGPEYLGKDDLRTVMAAAQVGDLAAEERDAVAKYQRHFDQALNTYRRKGLLPKDGPIGYQSDETWSDIESHPDEILRIDRDLTNLFKRVPPTPHHIEAWRGLSSQRDWKVGDTVIEKGYASTSLDRNLASRFSRSAGPEGDGGTILRIHIPPGAKVLDEYGNGTVYDQRRTEIAIEEKALLLPPGTRMRVTRVEGNEITVEVEPHEIADTPDIGEQARAALYERTLGIAPTTREEVEGWWANPYGRDLSKPTGLNARPDFAMTESEAQEYAKAHPRVYPPVVRRSKEEMDAWMAVSKTLTGNGPPEGVSEPHRMLAYKAWTLAHEARLAGQPFSFQTLPDYIRRAQEAWGERHGEPTRDEVDAWFEKIKSRPAAPMFQIRM